MYFNYNRTFLKPCTLETVWAGLLYTTLALVKLHFECIRIITLTHKVKMGCRCELRCRCDELKRLITPGIL